MSTYKNWNINLYPTYYLKRDPSVRVHAEQYFSWKRLAGINGCGVRATCLLPSKTKPFGPSVINVIFERDWIVYFEDTRDIYGIYREEFKQLFNPLVDLRPFGAYKVLFEKPLLLSGINLGL